MPTLYSVRQLPPEIFWHFSPYGSKFLVQILHAYYTFLSTLDYKFLFNYLQLWRSYAILSATTIICSKCPLSTETHAWWSHLIWHNFVTVGDNKPDSQWQSSSFQESKKVCVSRDLWPWPWPWAHPGCTLTWNLSCESLVAIRPFVCEKKRFAQKFTDGQTDRQTTDASPLH